MSRGTQRSDSTYRVWRAACRPPNTREKIPVSMQNFSSLDGLLQKFILGLRKLTREGVPLKSPLRKLRPKSILHWLEEGKLCIRAKLLEPNVILFSLQQLSVASDDRRLTTRYIASGWINMSIAHRAEMVSTDSIDESGRVVVTFMSHTNGENRFMVRRLKPSRILFRKFSIAASGSHSLISRL